MKKTLTEQFMNNELDDRLYYFTQKMSQDNVEIGHSFEFNMVRADDGEYLDWFLIKEVLAPVPSYEELREKEVIYNTTSRCNETLLWENESLKKKLAIATKALKEYANEKNWRTATTIINTDYFEYECSMYNLKNNGFEEAQKALKEMEGVK